MQARFARSTAIANNVRADQVMCSQACSLLPSIATLASRLANLQPQVRGAAAALGVLLLLRHSDRFKPYVGTALKELYSFKEWLLGKTEELKEDLEDVQAGAKVSYVQDVARHLEALEREKALVERIAGLMARKAEGKR